MGIDPVDIARDDINRAENRKATEKKDNQQRRGVSEFSARYQAKLNQAEKKEETKSFNQKGEGTQSEEGFFQRVVSVMQGKEEGRDQDKHDSKKKDETKKEKFQESTSDGKTKSVSDEGYGRVASKESRHQDSGSGGGSAGGGQSGGGGDQGSNQKSMGGNASGGGSGNSKEGKNFIKTLTPTSSGTSSFAIKSIGGLKGNANQGSKSGFSDAQFDGLIEGVRVTTQASGSTEVEIAVSDDLFPGLKIRATRKPEGIIIAFVCPDRATKNAFVLERSKVYDRLRQKGISIYRIDVV